MLSGGWGVSDALAAAQAFARGPHGARLLRPAGRDARGTYARALRSSLPAEGDDGPFVASHTEAGRADTRTFLRRALASGVPTIEQPRRRPTLSVRRACYTVVMFDLDRIGGPGALADLVDEVLGAGELALHIQRRGAAMEKKDDRSPVTEADRAVEERLRGYLARRYPDAGFLGEESGARDGSGLRWIVDPIDGTRAFVRGIPTWSVLVTLEADAIPAVAIAYMPASEDLFVGFLGGGARHNGRPCRVSTTAALDDALVGHGAIQQFTEAGRDALLLRLARETYTQRGFADFANYRELLLGRMDAVIDPGVKAYDVGPAAVLVQEAGGRWSDLAGRPTIHGDGFVASNGLVHEALLALAT